MVPKPQTGGGGGDGAAFSAMQGQVVEMQQVIAAMSNKITNDQFAGFVKGLEDSGHQFSAENARNMYARCKNDPQSVKALKDMLLASPKKTELSKMGLTFSAADSIEHLGNGEIANAESQVSDVQQILRQYVPSVNFSAQDINTGSVVGD